MSLNKNAFSKSTVQVGPWRLSNANISSVYARIDGAGQPLSRLCRLGQGMQTGLNSVFGRKSRAVVDAMGALPEQIRYRVRNTDIQRFHILERDELLLYLEDVPKFNALPNGVQKYLQGEKNKLEARAAFKRGNCEWWKYTWPLQKDLYVGPRIVCPYLSKENRFAIDNNFKFLGLTDTTVIFPADQKEDIRYICALLNSRILNLRFKGIGKLKSNGIREYFDNAVSQIPIRRISWKKASDVAIHDRIVALYEALADGLSALATPLAATVARDLRKKVLLDEAELDELVCGLYGFTAEEISGLEMMVA